MDSPRTHPSRNSDFAVCVLAHNEECHIEQTLAALCLPGSRHEFEIIVYANGCTDRTEEIVSRFAQDNPRVTVRSVPIASKPHSWNLAFAEQDREFIVFCDGDIVPDPGAAEGLVQLLETEAGVVMATCRQTTQPKGLSFQQKVVGFLQAPFSQDYLAGGIYAVKKSELSQLLQEFGWSGLPPGVTGEDCFLDRVVGGDKLRIADCRSFYEPPDFRDYYAYLARIRWQNEQLELFIPASNKGKRNTFQRLTRKVAMSARTGSLLPSLTALAARSVFKILTRPMVSRAYKELGPVREMGAGILSGATRAGSTRTKQ